MYTMIATRSDRLYGTNACRPISLSTWRCRKCFTNCRKMQKRIH